MSTRFQPQVAAKPDLVFERSRNWYDRACLTTPGGVHTNIRLGEQPWPLFFESGAGGRLQDVDGNEIIDYVCGNGPMILGHSPTPVIEAVKRQLNRGLLYAAQSTLEVEAAELLVQSIPCAEKVRFNLSGTEAIQAALRIARAATGRQKILIFQGHYHGWADSVLWNVGTPSRSVTGQEDLIEPLAESLGVEASVAGDLLIIQWNDRAMLERVLDTYGSVIAAVIMEPVMGNVGVIPPQPGYLEAARELTRKHGIVLIFDEVITGFRVAPGGAQVRLGVIPDLAVFGKAIAAGFPVACVVGRSDLFEGVGTGTVMHAGTFNSNPVGMAAVVAAIRVLTDPGAGVYERLEAAGTRLQDGMETIALESGAKLLVQGLPMLFNVAFTDLQAFQNHADTTTADSGALRRFQGQLIRRGVRLASRGNVYLSAAHTDEDIDLTLAVFRDALAAHQADASSV